MDLYSWFWLFAVVSAILYAVLMVWFMVGWQKNSFYEPSKTILNTKVSVIVPFYNEQESIATCLEGLLVQNIQSSDFNIIAINDNSTDLSGEIVKSLAKEYNRIVYLENDKKGKKTALAKAIDYSDSNLIVTTDSDCSYNPNWLSTIVNYYEDQKPKLIIGPVLLKKGRGLLSSFQQLEFFSLIMSTAGAAGIGRPIMCNGANLAFPKQVFSEFENPLNDKYISGDDVFLLHNIKKKYPDDIHFLKSKSAVVETLPTKGLSAFFKQRQRWVSKVGGYKDGDTLFTATVVFAVCMLQVIGALLLFKDIAFYQPLLLLFVAKLSVDSLFFYITNSFFDSKKYLPFLFLFEVVYVLYTSFVSVSGFIISKKWKV